MQLKSCSQMVKKSLQKKSSKVVLFSFLFFIHPTIGQAEIAVIVNPGSSVSQLTQEQIKEIFLGSTTTLGSDTAMLFDQDSSSAIRESFYQKVTGKSARSVMATWSKLVFTGKGKEPKALNSDKAIIEAVKGSKGGIGYVEAKSVDASVKTVHTIP